MKRMTLLAMLAALSLALEAAPQVDTAKVQTLVSQRNVAGLKAIGTSVLPVLVQMYRVSDDDRKTDIAETLYQLGWKSPEAKQVLMADVHTPNQNLRLQVQWALGRVSAG